ncbi:DUF6456 domain-containing protein [Amaricoccus tamworthensis]|uniref:DUF6456 domain-containing protein n=1 Tax=Amaricoccus tamworthensis TaxID=57002 RepID=UPI003C7B6217
MLPFWLPEPAVTYLAHTSAGHAIRALARAKGCHASTVLRQVRKVEAWRDDPLVDEALDEFGRTIASQLSELNELEEVLPVSKPNTQKSTSADLKIEREARRILRRLCEKGAFLAVAPNMEKAVVLREVVPGRQNRIAVVDRDVAHAFALQEWISCEKQGKICCYEITAVGRAALKRLLAEERQAKTTNTGFAEEHSPFQEQHRDYAERVVPGNGGKGEKVRYNLAESPLSVLGRKRGKDGKPYLDADLIEAGERLREDFELAQMGASTTQNWESFLTAGTNRGSAGSFGSSPAEGPSDARTRVAKALEAMGPGLSDIVFRVCCFLEGLETAEKRLGWSARSGKVVLKIALDRLATHYRSPGQIQEFRKAG